MKKLSLLLTCLMLGLYSSGQEKDQNDIQEQGVSLVVLGNVQDGGSPHIGCNKVCCSALFKKPDPDRKVVALGLVDHENEKRYLFEATPDLTSQKKHLKEYGKPANSETPDGIFLTHAHIGHYSGLMYLGKEAMNADSTPVYAMPKMKEFLKNHGPWSQLVSNSNILIKDLFDEQRVELTPQISVTPFKVPHRDEYSETVGYRIEGPKKTALFIPDIDKWNKWEKDIVAEIKKVDYAFLDATFFDAKEINNRDISEIPHPFVIESMNNFKDLTANEKAKIFFIHFNHTNPLLDHQSEEYMKVLKAGFNVANIRDVFKL
ncbi:MBL fold metallo-hydrolase [Christiangramia salexigens]|uniref:Pyrroloquinoline quinone biosynthesis protein PqqB n=1 Tax=Christiangramia salexigens TaxID=1913577 RepID=A0A1L3J477_9FLAO|nr:MBL fold metallo-hydrolase [Christiangramia salexigens]APG59912.1 pyrroloquinoline quinone biosynthesis protein PqqB [Christiangramia salexigens]